LYYEYVGNSRNRGAAQTIHGALDVTRNVVCSPHAHHLAQHSEHEEKPQLEYFKGFS
jgi:hypothetical protein